jgi:uncharacterized membrane protein YphA (DoxX/SURF4 family)
MQKSDNMRSESRRGAQHAPSSVITDKAAYRKAGLRVIIAIIACVILASIFLFAGIGKVGQMGQMPGQLEYLDKIIPDYLFTPAVGRFTGFVFIPYVLPIFETFIGLALLAGFLIKIDALLAMLLSGAFAYHNIWLINHGIDRFPDCSCFGFWETAFGVVSPAASLRIDILMIALALIVIFVQPGGLLTSQFWFRQHQP